MTTFIWGERKMGTSGLAKHLIKEGYITENECQLISRDYSNSGASFAKVIISLGVLSEVKLAKLLAEKSKCAMIPHREYCVTEPSAEGCIDGPLLQSLEVVPLSLEGSTLKVAMLDPLDQNILEQLKFFTPYKIKPVVATLASIHNSLQNIVHGFHSEKTSLQKLLSHCQLERQGATSTAAMDHSGTAKNFDDEEVQSYQAAHSLRSDDFDDDNDVESFGEDLGSQGTSRAASSDEDGFEDEFSDSEEGAEDVDFDNFDQAEDLPELQDNDEDIPVHDSPERAFGDQDSLEGFEGDSGKGVAVDRSDTGEDNFDSDEKLGVGGVSLWDEEEPGLTEEASTNAGGESQKSSNTQATASSVQLWDDDDDDDVQGDQAGSDHNTDISQGLESGGMALWGVDDEPVSEAKPRSDANKTKDDSFSLFSEVDPGTDEREASENDILASYEGAQEDSQNENDLFFDAPQEGDQSTSENSDDLLADDQLDELSDDISDLEDLQHGSDADALDQAEEMPEIDDGFDGDGDQVSRLETMGREGDEFEDQSFAAEMDELAMEQGEDQIEEIEDDPVLDEVDVEGLQHIAMAESDDEVDDFLDNGDLGEDDGGETTHELDDLMGDLDAAQVGGESNGLLQEEEETVSVQLQQDEFDLDIEENSEPDDFVEEVEGQVDEWQGEGDVLESEKEDIFSEKVRAAQDNQEDSTKIVSVLNKGLVGVSLAFTEQKAKSLAAQVLSEGGIASGTLFEQKEEGWQAVTSWQNGQANNESLKLNEGSLNVAAEISATNGEQWVEMNQLGDGYSEMSAMAFENRDKRKFLTLAQVPKHILGMKNITEMFAKFLKLVSQKIK